MLQQGLARGANRWQTRGKPVWMSMNESKSTKSIVFGFTHGELDKSFVLSEASDKSFICWKLVLLKICFV